MDSTPFNGDVRFSEDSLLSERPLNCSVSRTHDKIVTDASTDDKFWTPKQGILISKGSLSQLQSKLIFSRRGVLPLPRALWKPELPGSIYGRGAGSGYKGFCSLNKEDQVPSRLEALDGWSAPLRLGRTGVGGALTRQVVVEVSDK